MANPEHLEMLLQGVNEWRQWRKYNWKIKPDLREVDLKWADLSEADLSRADLSWAILMGAGLSWAILSGANLSEANLSEADIGATIFGDNDLSSVKGLDSVIHRGPSTIGIDTLYKSSGKIPESFLRGCGVPKEFIAFIPSHFGARQAVQFYSCFISYSGKDEDFAKRLHSRLRDAKVRVWFAPEDMKGGDKLYDQIERAIHLHDRLLIVLSENSVQSEWVMTEIRRAREVEKKENRRKCNGPLKLDTKLLFESVSHNDCLDH